MGKRHSGGRALAAVIAIALLFAGLWGAYRVGWQEGYRLGWLVERSQEGETSSAEPYGYGPGTHRPFAGPRAGGLTRFGGLGHLSCLRPLFTFLLLLLALGLIAKFFGFWAWKRGWGPAGKDWHKHWAHGGPWPHRHPPHGPRGPMPPWCWGKEDVGDQGPADRESGDQESADQGAGEEQMGKVKPE